MASILCSIQVHLSPHYDAEKARTKNTAYDATISFFTDADTMPTIAIDITDVTEETQEHVGTLYIETIDDIKMIHAALSLYIQKQGEIK